MQLYSLLDTKAERCAPPFLASTDNEAARLVAISVARSGTLPAEYPEDFVLIRVGEWDETTGVVTPCVPITIQNVRALLQALGRPSSALLPEEAKGENSEEVKQ